MIKKLRILAIPKVNFPEEVTKLEVVEGKILNFNNDITYTINCNEGIITYISGDTFVYTAPDIIEDITDTIVVIGEKLEHRETRVEIEFIVRDQFLRTTQKPNIVFPDEVEEGTNTLCYIAGWRSNNNF